MSSSILTDRLGGRYDYGQCGMTPSLRLDVVKPVRRNNGFACFSGHLLVHVPGLAVALPDERRAIGQGHVIIDHADEQQFGTYPMTLRDGDVYDFS